MLPRHPRDIFDECPSCICISSPCALCPPDKSAFPLCVPCFRLLNLHVLSVWPAPACEIRISSPCGLLPPAKVAFPLCVSCFRLLNLHVLSVWPCFRLLNLHFLSLCLASACYICISSPCGPPPPAKFAFPLRVPCFRLHAS